LVYNNKMEKVLQYVRRRVAQCGGVFNPIVVTDIDGVLLRGHTPIPGTLEAVRELRTTGIPLGCLTNGGGQLESLKVSKMNQIFGEQLFSTDKMFMNHSPMRPHLIQFSKEPGVLLVSGSLKVTDILDDLGIVNYVTADELYALFHRGEREGPH
jgi:ribonucleotide monophosphatase NagD (HAD superfamily)